MPAGPLPTRIVSTTPPLPPFAFGSIFETVFSKLFVTQTKPPPTAIPLGLLPTGIVLTTIRFSGSIRETELPSAFVTQIARSPTAM